MQVNIERLLDRELVPVESVRHFRCESEGYDVVVYHNGFAVMNFDLGDTLDVDHFTEGHIAYYVGSGYWNLK